MRFLNFFSIFEIAVYQEQKKRQKVNGEGSVLKLKSDKKTNLRESQSKDNSCCG